MPSIEIDADAYATLERLMANMGYGANTVVLTALMGLERELKAVPARRGRPPKDEAQRPPKPIRPKRLSNGPHYLTVKACKPIYGNVYTGSITFEIDAEHEVTVAVNNISWNAIMQDLKNMGTDISDGIVGKSVPIVCYQGVPSRTLNGTRFT